MTFKVGDKAKLGEEQVIIVGISSETDQKGCHYKSITFESVDFNHIVNVPAKFLTEIPQKPESKFKIGEKIWISFIIVSEKDEHGFYGVSSDMESWAMNVREEEIYRLQDIPTGDK
jgi:hypothetical protein